jgi:hypothetical protein
LTPVTSDIQEQIDDTNTKISTTDETRKDYIDNQISDV